jgi:5-methyltetrahydropteroyltriglutamate--homocysteine methyltransferase
MAKNPSQRLTIPTEPIGSIPRPPALIQAVAQKGDDDPSVDLLYEAAVRGRASDRGTD